ncbi:hypothetical protein C2S51_035410 [Perilla frutescens var. frutescens]|nr:hypothetical protein C2S51_035410 [Perilla frutescens var. frutescens]
MDDLNVEQRQIENVTKSLCWKKLVEGNDISIWQKPLNHMSCKRASFCLAQEDPDKAWYTKLETCLSRLLEVSESDEVAGDEVERWLSRLKVVSPRISRGTIDGVTTEIFHQDLQLWNKRVAY